MNWRFGPEYSLGAKGGLGRRSSVSGVFVKLMKSQVNWGMEEEVGKRIALGGVLVIVFFWNG